jgi:murein DD-endopeptidase MepM/ murein hydrolase activator NlpD
VMRDHLQDRPRRRVRIAPLLGGTVLAAALAVLAVLTAVRLDRAAPQQPLVGDSPAGAYAQDQATRALLQAETSGRAAGTMTPSTMNPSTMTTGSLDPGSAAAGVHYRFPVAGKVTYGRSHHDYPATDIFARCGSAFVAAADGTIESVSSTDRWRAGTNRGPDRGGLSVSVLGRDGVRYYGSHLRAVRSGVKVGVAVRAGAELGEVGQTGSAEGTGCHLHFGISPACPALHGADWWNRRGAIPPAPFLDAWRRGGSPSPVGTVAAWQRAHGCPTAPVSYP